MNRKLFFLATFALTLLLAAVSFGSAPDVAQATAATFTKQLAAPPSEFAALSMPNSAEAGTTSHTALIPVQLTEGRDGLWRWHGEVNIDDGRAVTLMVLSAPADQWQLALSSDTNLLDLAPSQAMPANIEYQRSQFALAEGEGYPADVYLWEEAPSGRWQLTITAAKPSMTEGYLVIGQESPYKLYAHLNHYQLHVGREVGLTAYLHDTRFTSRDAERTPLRGTIDQATMLVKTPAGQELAIPMQDNGNGEFVAWTTPTAAGDYIAQVQISGTTPEGQAFVRTSEHVFPVIAPALQLSTSTVVGQSATNGRLTLNLNTTTTNNSAADQANSYWMSAELWGTNDQRELVPVVWLGGMADVQTSTWGQTSLPLSLDTRWIAFAKVQAPFELRHVRVQDSQTNIPVAQADTLAVRLPRSAVSNLATVENISQDMLMGARPDAALVTNQGQGINNSGKLLLVHGYCSGGVWPTNQFSNASTFLDANQNRSHDQFANLIRNHGAQFPSFGVVAHSQGGAASLHLYTYYWSGLDYSSGSRLIQSVGTPYQGTALAGSLAMIGDVFGAGCGTNWNMTYDGASLWLSGIPTWARNRVYYHTTSFATAWWRYDYCHLGTDMFLSDPEDGTTERAYGQLPGANNMGHKTGWCHTASMRDPAQYTDSSRNSNMNTYANR
jgi:hypothetical protein